MTRMHIRLHRWIGLAAVSALTVLALPVVPAGAEGLDPASDASAGVDQQAASAAREPVNSMARPSFIFPELTYLPGIGWEVDTGGPAVRIEYLSED